jgi:hypothetical protein
MSRLRSCVLAVAITAVALLTVSDGARADELAQFGAVRRWHDLAKAEPVDLGDGIRARIAVDTDRPSAGGHVVIYCLTEGMAADAIKRVLVEDDDRIGPVRFRIGPADDHERVAAKAPDRVREARRVRVAEQAGPKIERAELLFSRAVATPKSGRLLLTLSTAAGRDVADIPIVVTADVPPTWTAFAATFPSRDAITPADLEAGVTVHVANRLTDPVEPVWPAEQPIVWKGTVDGKAFERDGDELLPSLQDPGAGTLAYRDGVLVFTTKQPVACRPDLHLIARWWVNDKPVRSEPVAGFARQVSGRVGTAAEHRMRLTFDPGRFQAKSGDTVKLQVAWCEQGWRTWSPDGARQHTISGRAEPIGPGPVILSNAVEFVVP